MIPVILLVVAVAVGVVAGLAWSANLPGNGYVGIRAPEARKSRENWDITHRVAGPPWAVSALAFAGSAALAYVAVQPDASGWMWLWVAVTGLLGLAMLGVGGAIGSHTIALYDAKKSAEAESDGCCSSGGSDGAGADAACGSGCGCGSAEADACDSGTAGTDATAAKSTAADACCSADSTAAGAPATGAPAAPRDPSADCGVTGGCGSCGLNGMCEGGGSSVDREALRRAARANDAE